ncbi:hypothetical protein GOC74_09945 [Halomicrobium mukohataei]|uniref:Uncharacterized protein n=1 Tax=Halomicrobium mukohataei TaxID=57705 RepID=A0A847UFE1_9EURY|nr:hypothetical protein [Halomicrobium mukohataei]NLV10250.1 hypothetical protein [Halomicrobium mukohataei]
MSSDEDTEATPLYRRPFLWLFGGIVGLGVIASSSDEDGPDFSSEETDLKELAATIESTDLRAPQNNLVIWSSIDQTLQSVTSSLSEKGVDPDGMPQTRSSTSTPSTGINDIYRALRYYRELRQDLTEADSLRESVEERESITFHTEPLGDGSDPEVRLQNIGSEITAFADTLDGRSPESVPSTTRSLLPNRETVNNQLSQQKAVYERHARLQEQFLSVTSSINSGVDDFEHSSYNSATQAFREARSATTVQVSSSLRSYSLASSTLSLGDYGEIFGLYQSAVDSMIAACTEGMSRAERNEEIDRGLERQFEARSLFADRGSS